MNIGYACVSTDPQDVTAQCNGLHALGVPAYRIDVDHGLTGSNRERPGVHQALVGLQGPQPRANAAEISRTGGAAAAVVALLTRAATGRAGDRASSTPTTSPGLLLS